MNINTYTESKDIPCNPVVNTKYDEIVYANLTKQLLLEFGCTVPFLPQLKITDAPERVKICREPETRKNAYAKYDLLKRNNENYLCPNPCNTIQPYFGLFFQDPTYEKKDKAYIKIYRYLINCIPIKPFYAHVLKHASRD